VAKRRGSEAARGAAVAMRALRLLTAVSYPILVYAGLTRVGPRALAAILVAIVVGHGAMAWRQRRSEVLRLLLPVAGAFLLAALLNQGRFFLLVPVLINTLLLIAFGRTLLSGPSMVETFARLRGRKLPSEEVVYCRVVTGLWCLFFVFNGVFTLWLALYARLAWWTFYTGGLSYALIGLLFTTEMIYRYWRFRPYDGSVTDPLFRRIFPPRGGS
jgi:uncharacterized membrane protein